jgi:hypothetical protein
MIFRDEERGSRISIAVNNNLATSRWQVHDLTTFPVGAWEPSYYTELWTRKKVLNLFVQKVQQVDGEGLANNPAQPVQVLEWRPAMQH